MMSFRIFKAPFVRGPNTTAQIECTKEKHMNVHENLKFKVLGLLRTILHRIGRFLATRARFCAQ